MNTAVSRYHISVWLSLLFINGTCHCLCTLEQTVLCLHRDTGPGFKFCSVRSQFKLCAQSVQHVKDATRLHQHKQYISSNTMHTNTFLEQAAWPFSISSFWQNLQPSLRSDKISQFTRLVETKISQQLFIDTLQYQCISHCFQGIHSADFLNPHFFPETNKSLTF